MRTPAPRASAALVAAAVLSPLTLFAACAAPADEAPRPSVRPSPSTSLHAGQGSGAAAETPATLGPSAAFTPPPAGVGRNAPSQRETFAPQRIRLLSQGGVSAPVQTVDTGPDGYLELPADPGVTGWWVSGALAGEVFGSVVLAGHIDSRERGVGFFAQLLDATPGDRIELSGSGLRLTYVVRSNEEVDKGVLSTRTGTFDRSVRGRLVLLTCTGRFDRRTRHYDHNLVVTADPEGVSGPLPH